MAFLNFSFSAWKKFDWILALAVLVLSVISIATIYSVDLSRGEDLNYFPTQIIALALAVLVFFIASQLHISFYESISPILYFISILLLILVLFFGTTIRGTTGWFRISGFSFQPAELAKIALIIFLAWRIERQARRFEKIQFIIVTGLISLLPVGLILLQPDFGSAMILASIWFSMLIAVGTKRKYIISIILLGLTTFIAGWFFLFTTNQKERILTFVNPERSPLTYGYNVSQSIIAIGSGEFFGRGLGFGSQSQLHFLPEAHTDFIFSVISEELGFIGSFLVLIIYFIILWRLINIAKHCNNDFQAYTIIGIAIVFFLHITINIGAAIGILPVTGVTLPFLSYGGSSLIINFSLIGIAESATQSQK